MPMAKLPRLVKAMLLCFLLFEISFIPTLMNLGNKGDGTGPTGIWILAYALIYILVLYLSFIFSLITSMINLGLYLKKGGLYFWLSAIIFFATAGTLLYIFLIS